MEQTGRIGAYRLVRRLGAGGMGEVWLAFDERLERLVAVKRIRSDRAGSPELGERFRREARAIARLDHANVVRIFDLLPPEGDAGPAIVMEYVEGEALSDLLRRGPLPVALAVRIGAQVAHGLAAAHEAGLVHRDLKPGNVLWSREGQAKILDFGLARPAAPAAGESLTHDGAVLGTFGSMSPEQVRGEAVDARSDLFSLGVLLYEMLAGRPPFLGPTPFDTLRNVMEATPPALAGERAELPPALVELVDGLLEKAPARRPGAAEPVARALEDLGAALPLPPAAAAAGSTAGPSPFTFPALPARGAPVIGSSGLSGRWRRLPLGARGLAVGGLAAALLLPLAVRQAALEHGPLRVAVLDPAVAGEPGERLDSAAEGTRIALLRGLRTFVGVSPVEPGPMAGVRASPAGIARAAGADEALVAAVEVRRTAGRIALQRIRASDGAVLWAEAIEVPAAREDTLVLANAVATALRRAYPERSLRPDAPDLAARAEDYAAFVEVKRRVNAGRAAWAPELARLDAIVRGSPRLLDAHLSAALLALNLYGDTREPAYLERARRSLALAKEIDAGYPPLTIAEIRVALAASDWARAERALAELERQLPGDLLVASERARLAEARGRLTAAAGFLRSAVERRPAWRELLRLADLESKSGAVTEARAHLQQALALAPGHTWVLAKLGELELLHGELGRARQVYEQLVAGGAQRSDLTNLGLVHFLLGEYDQAVARYRQALDMAPDHLYVLLNLADAELARGRPEIARQLYGRALDRLTAQEATAALLPAERTTKAQCLARLGRTEEAVALALAVVQANPEDGEVAYQAALVLSLAGQDTAALALARQALAHEVEPRWFTIPGFERLRARLDLAPGR